MSLETPKYSRQVFDEADADLQAVKGSISGEMSADELLVAAQKKEALEQKKTGLHDQARTMAEEEDAERTFVADSKKKTEEQQAERRVSPEQLQASVETLEVNIAKMDQIPESVLQSPEGQEATQSLQERIVAKLGDFRKGVVDRLATLDSWEGKDKMAKVLSGVAGAAILGPLVLQMARSKWPEAGVALDAAPDALQQFIHLDVGAKLIQLFGGSDMLQGGSMWANGSIEVNNLLTDIGSGKESVASLSSEQLKLLQENMTGPHSFDVLTSPGSKDSGGYAASAANATTWLRTIFGNMPLIGTAGAGVYGAMSKIGSLANKYKEKTT